MRTQSSMRYYNFAVVILAIVSVILAVMDLLSGLPPILMLIDWVIYAAFLADYIIRLFFSDSRKAFVRSNVLDLVAIIPFSSAFRVFRTLKILKAAKLAKVARLSKLARVGSVSARGLSKAKKFVNTNGLKYMLVVSAAAVLSGALAMSVVEGMPFEDSLWWSFVTATTVGYGDLSPETGIGRVVAAMLMLVGIGLIGSLTSTITSFFLQKDQAEPADSSEPSGERVEMAFSVYQSLLESLNESERQAFAKLIMDQIYEE